MIRNYTKTIKACLAEAVPILGTPLDGDDVSEILNGIVATARRLALEVNEADIEELLTNYEEELTIEDLQNLWNEKHQKTFKDVPTSYKWEDVRITILEWHLNQVEVNRVGDLYNVNLPASEKAEEERNAIDINRHL